MAVPEKVLNWLYSVLTSVRAYQYPYMTRSNVREV